MNEDILIEKFNLSQKDVMSIEMRYVSISTFVQKYLEFLKGNKSIDIKVPKSVASKVTNYFDLSNAYSVGENSGYAKFAADILKIKSGFVTYMPIDEIINYAIEDSLSEKEKDIIKSLYKLNCKGKTIDELAKQYRTSREEIIAIRNRTINRFSSYRKENVSITAIK